MFRDCDLSMVSPYYFLNATDVAFALYGGHKTCFIHVFNAVIISVLRNSTIQSLCTLLFLSA